MTTTVIADEMNISPGNLYYHFHSKDEIVNDLFSDFEREIDRLLSVPSRRNTDVEDVWLYLHLLFESIWRYRFLYRDLVDLLTRNRLLEVHVGRILERKVNTAMQLCEGLVEAQKMQASPAEIDALANNMAALGTCWLSFSYARNPRRQMEGEALSRAVYQIMAMLAPFLVGDSRALLERLSAEYIKQQPKEQR